ncbi:MAG: ORC1-type DNA replication protein [Candidatus Ranarchaeia archaeon]
MKEERPLDAIFDKFLSGPRLFRRKDRLSIDYVPDHLPHRDNQIKKIGLILATALKGGVPSNILCYGQTGTGKTAVAKYVLEELRKKSSLTNNEPLSYSYINCRTVNTHYRILARLCNDLDLTEKKVPFTGLPTDEVFQKFYDGLDRKKRLTIVILDEIDFLARNRENDVLYDLTRIGSQLKRSNLRLIGISNDLLFKEMLDARVLSSLSEEEIVFPPYTATELQDILWDRAKQAFMPGVIQNGVINLCSALAAREHGDARRAIDLLRVAGELAERNGSTVVTEDHVRDAVRQIDTDTIHDVIETMPVHMKLVLYSIYLLESKGNKKANTGDVFTIYKRICKNTNIEALTQRRVSDLLSELDIEGLINARIISKGRYGRTKLISLNTGIKNIRQLLENDELIGHIAKAVPSLL